MEMKEKLGGSVFWKLVLLPFVLMVIWVSCFKFNNFAYPTFGIFSNSTPSGSVDTSLPAVLERASMENKTVIITFLNEAWAAPNSMFDVFLESFRRGNQTQELLKHIVAVAVDQKAYVRCLEIHPHCYNLSGRNSSNTTNSTSKELYYMTPAYFALMWRRVKFLISVVEQGYSFIFTDCDVMWFRNPFPHFYPDADFQIACDAYTGNPTSLRNWPNGGFIYVLSNNRTIEFYKFWYASRYTYPRLNEQDVFNKIKFGLIITKIGLKIYFLDTQYYGGFCQPSKDLNKVCTMHANCCFGLENKVHDLDIMLQDWTRYLSAETNGSSSQPSSWTVPQKCINSYHPPDPPKNKTQPV